MPLALDPNIVPLHTVMTVSNEDKLDCWSFVSCFCVMFCVSKCMVTLPKRSPAISEVQTL